jgi:hypothetical protein
MGDPDDPSNALRGATVRFKVADVILPPADELLRRLFGDDMLQGRVVRETAGDGTTSGHVAVEVPGLVEPVIIPRSKLVVAAGFRDAGARKQDQRS